MADLRRPGGGAAAAVGRPAVPPGRDADRRPGRRGAPDAGSGPRGAPDLLHDRLRHLRDRPDVAVAGHRVRLRWRGRRPDRGVGGAVGGSGARPRARGGVRLGRGSRPAVPGRARSSRARTRQRDAAVGGRQAATRTAARHHGQAVSALAAARRARARPGRAAPSGHHLRPRLASGCDRAGGGAVPAGAHPPRLGARCRAAPGQRQDQDLPAEPGPTDPGARRDLRAARRPRGAAPGSADPDGGWRSRCRTRPDGRWRSRPSRSRWWPRTKRLSGSGPSS